MSYLFLFRKKDAEYDRDCCAYIDSRNPRWERGHYFGGINLHGVCYCGKDFPKYEEIETVLPENEYKELIAFDNAIHDLGYGITESDDRYQKGIELSKNIQHVFDKLKSKEAEEFQQKIIESEIKYLKEKYSLSNEDIKRIFDKSSCEFRDRAIVSCVFANSYDLGFEEAHNFGYIKNGDNILEKYVDYKKFGEDLLEDGQYLQLNDGRIICLNY